MRGLVLEGGGLKGSYQVGAFYALMKCGIKFDGYVGTSIGSFNAAMLASNKYRELLDFWYNLDISKVLSLDEKFIEEYNRNKKSFSTLKEAFAEFGDFIRNHGIKYEGTWKNDKEHGQGVFKFNNGNVYEGELKEGAITGKGVLTLNNGEVFRGMFNNGVIYGKGNWSNSKEEKYIGFFIFLLYNL